jgi:hypothetical protein
MSCILLLLMTSYACNNQIGHGVDAIGHHSG